MSYPKRPDFEVRTPCGGAIGDPRTKWRTIGEAWVNNEDGFISARVDLPVQNGRIILVPFEKESGTQPAKRKTKADKDKEKAIEEAADAYTKRTKLAEEATKEPIP